MHIGIEKIIMALALVVTGICGAKVIQEVSIIKYAVFWYFFRIDNEFALEMGAYVFPKLLCTSICSLGAGIFLVISFWAGIALLRKAKTSNIKILAILAAAVVLIILCSVFAVKCIGDIKQPPFLVQEGRTNLGEEYQIHIVSKIYPIALFSLLTGVLIAISFGLLKDVRKPPLESSRFEKPPPEPPRIEKPPPEPPRIEKPPPEPPRIEKPPPEPPHPEKPSEPKPYDLNTLKVQLARGEITLEEFESMKPKVEYDLNTLKVQLARGEITLEEFESKKAELEKY